MNEFFNCFNGIPGLDIEAIIPNTLGNNLSYLEEVNSIKKLLLLLLKNKDNIFPKFKFMGDWDITKAYPKWAIVNDTATGNGYISIKPVPYGIELNNSDFWVKIANYDALYSAFEERVSALESYCNDLNNEILPDLNSRLDTKLNNNNVNMTFENSYINEELQAFIDNSSDGDILIFPKDGNFSMSDGVTVNKSITIDLNGSTLTCQSNDIFKCHSEIVTTHYVTIDSTSGHLTLDSIADVEKNMLVRIEGTANYELSRYYYKCGGVSCVEKINGNTIQLTNNFPTQTINNGSKIEFFNPITVHIKNGTLNSLAEGSCSTAIYLRNNINSTIKNLTINNCQINIRNTGSINTVVSNVKIYGGKSLSTYSWSGYGILIDECLNTSIKNALIYSGQHGISIGGFLPSYNNIIENVVCCSEYGTVGLDCHQTNYSMSVKNVISQGYFLAGNCIVENSQSANIRGDSNLYGVGLIGNSEIYDRASFIFKNFKCYTGRISSTYDNQIIFENCYSSEGWAISNGLDLVLQVTLLNCIGDQYAIFGHVRSLKIDNSQITADLTIANLNRAACILNSIFSNTIISASSAYITMEACRMEGTTQHSITALYCTLIGCVFSTTLSKFAIVCSNLFCTAPRPDLIEEIFAIAFVIEEIAERAPSNEATSISLIPSLLAPTSWILIWILCADTLAAPT